MLNGLRQGCLYPSELQSCQRVFDRLCQEMRLERTSDDAADLASQVLIAFQYGHSEEADLYAAVTHRSTAA